MNWFRHNRFFGTFLVAFAIATLGAIVFLWLAKSGFSETKGRFDQTVSELNRLQHLTPFPNDTNLRKLKTQAEDYAAELNKTKEELTARVLPVKPMAPNEFQARLRQAMAAVGERARTNRVKLPDNFFLGFDEFAAALPDTAAAPLLGQQLAQVELLVDLMIDARVDAISSLKRVSAADLRSAPAPTPVATNAAAAARKPATTTPAAPLIERADVDATFVSNPAAARRVLNGITTANQQFYIIRTLHVLNEKDKGPPRDEARAVPADSAARATSGTGAVAGITALNFIVGNERIQTSARVEMLRFTF